MMYFHVLTVVWYFQVFSCVVWYCLVFSGIVLCCLVFSGFVLCYLFICLYVAFLWLKGTICTFKF